MKQVKINSKDKIVLNYTDHEVKDLLTQTTFPHIEKGLVNVLLKSSHVGNINGVPVKESQVEAIIGLPEEDDKHLYIVSSLVVSALKELGIVRNDLVSPGATKRGKEGVRGCMGLRLTDLNIKEK